MSTLVAQLRLCHQRTGLEVVDEAASRIEADYVRIAELEQQVAELRNACTMAHKFLQEQPRSERQADVLRFVDAALAQAKTAEKGEA